MSLFAARDHAADLAVARETATWWHAAAERERARAETAEETAKLWSDRYHRIVERLLASAQRATTGATTAPEAAGHPQEPANAAEAPPMPPEVTNAVRRIAGTNAMIAQRFMAWLSEPAQRVRWASGDPKSVKSVVDEICRGKSG